MRRYVVQVEDVPETTNSQQPVSSSATTVPSAQSAPSAYHGKVSRTRRFVVETEVDQPISAAHAHSQPQAFSAKATIPTPQSVLQPIKPEPEDYVNKREAALKKIWEEDRKKALPENPEVITPRREKSDISTNATQETSRSKDPQDWQKIEGFYQKMKPKVPVSRQSRKHSRRLLWSKHKRGITFICIVGIIIVTAWGSLMAVKAELNSATHQAQALTEDLKNARFTSAQERVEILQRKHSRYRWLYTIMRPAVRLTQGQEKTTHVDRLFEVSAKGIEIVDSGLQLYTDLEHGYQQFVGSQPGESVETFTNLTGQFETLFTQLSGLQSEVQTLGNPYNIEFIAEINGHLSRELPGLRKTVLSAQKVSYILPQLLGEKEEKTYLVLFQNNAELRPTGGFIGSFGIVRLKNGKLVEFRVEDVYEADGQLNGFVTPPEEIVQYLNEEQWYLRDVNWSPDFPTVAQRANWFIDKAMGVKPDGVIALNLEVAKRLLAVTGPIEIVDYNEVITQDNLFQQAQTHSEINFFPGSNGKKDFLSAVATQLMNKMFYQPSNKLQLAQALLDSADESELFISLNEPAAEEVFATLGWNGEVRTPSCPAIFSQENCFVDTVMQVEANVGVNKANQFIERTINQESEILSDRVRHTREVILTNNSASEAWPAGKYKVYMRWFVTRGSELRSLTVDGQPMDISLVKRQQEVEKDVYGFFVEVPIKSTKTISLFYETPLPANLKTYALFEQKQSGTSGDAVKHVFNVGDRAVSSVAPEPQIAGRELTFTSNRQSHDFMAVEF
jgi:hypothetical protein